MIRQIIRSVSAFALLLVFLAGSTGITFSVHLCGSTGTRQVTAYPEFSRSRVSCCCEPDPAITTATASLSGESCCRTTHGFLKADFRAIQPEPWKVVKAIQPVAELFTGRQITEISEPDRSSRSFMDDPSPPPGAKPSCWRFTSRKFLQPIPLYRNA